MQKAVLSFVLVTLALLDWSKNGNGKNGISICGVSICAASAAHAPLSQAFAPFPGDWEDCAGELSSLNGAGRLPDLYGDLLSLFDSDVSNLPNLSKFG